MSILDPIFQSTPLIRGATIRRVEDVVVVVISIHAPHTRSDISIRHRLALAVHISIHAPHTRSDITLARDGTATFISIHAPHTRSDFHLLHVSHSETDFNPRPSYEERRRGTRLAPGKKISIHAPHTRSDVCCRGDFHRYEISIHAPHTRSDGRHNSCRSVIHKFQSTPLIRGATAVGSFIETRTIISIHAPHTRSDLTISRLRLVSSHFNPRPSYEERRRSQSSPRARNDFNPRPSYEERRDGRLDILREIRISIHAPHTRSDRISGCR